MPNLSSALTFITAAWNGIPRRSWRNRNAAMSTALDTAISSGMEFGPDDMRTIASRFNASYWTSDGEGIYTLACSAKSGVNVSAAIALEKWLGRPAYLWAEETKTPARLHVGAKLTWEGQRLEVTSLRADHLVACAYDEQRDDTIWHDGGYRTIEWQKTLEDGHVISRYSPILKHDVVRGGSVKRVIKIKHADLQAKRAAYDAARRAWIKKIEAVADLDAMDILMREFAGETLTNYRHFDVEIIREASSAKHHRLIESMSEAENRQRQAQRKAEETRTHDADLARWMAGENVRRYFEVVRLRVKDGWVETSTQQRATLDGVRTALAFIKQHRRKGWTANGTTFDLDQYPLKSITQKGVQVGCTLVPWPEVDRIANALKNP